MIETQPSCICIVVSNCTFWTTFVEGKRRQMDTDCRVMVGIEQMEGDGRKES